MRFLKELRQPALKCERLGHKTAISYRTGMVRSTGRYVCDRVEQDQQSCSRCGLVLMPWREISRSGISSWSAPSEIMRKFERTGEYWR